MEAVTQRDEELSDACSRAVTSVVDKVGPAVVSVEVKWPGRGRATAADPGKKRAPARASLWLQTVLC